MCLAEGVSLSYQWTIDPELNCVDCVQGRNEQILFLQNVPFHGIVHVTCIVTDIVQQKHSRSAVLTILGKFEIEVWMHGLISHAVYFR